MPNEYGLDADYFIRLCAREFNPDVIRNQNPEDLARAFARAARTACAQVLQEKEFQAARPAQTEQSENTRRTLRWVVDRWHAEVANRPLVNVYRRALDSTWRQMIRHLGEDDVVLLGPRHDDMLDASGNPLPLYVSAPIDSQGGHCD